MSKAAIDWWLAGLGHLQAAADRVIVFVHPIDISRIQLPRPDQSVVNWGRVDGINLGAGNVQFIDSDVFDIDPTDFLDINHVRPGNGCENLTRQLAEQILLLQPLDPDNS